MSEAPGDGPQFSRRNLVRGYNAEQVDALLAEVRAAIGEGRPVPNLVSVTLEPQYGGYNEYEVDTFLDDLAGQLREAGLHD